MQTFRPSLFEDCVEACICAELWQKVISIFLPQCLDLSSPWQRGSNENTNGLLRQYFPKTTDLSGHSQTQLNRIALRLNTRPRKTLGFRTPAAKLHEAVAWTG